MSKVLLLLTLTLLASCSSGGGDNGCAWARPIRVSPDDHLTRETAQEILEHDETGARVCGW